VVNLEAKSSRSHSSLGWSTLAGVTKDVSRGGILLSADEEIAVGTECVVHFLVSKHQIEPLTTSGIVLRAELRQSGYDIALEFTTSLQVLKLASESE